MSSGIQPRPLAEVGKIFAEELGLDWCEDRQEVLKKLNEMRELLYIDPDMPKLFTDKFYCLELQCFLQDCVDCDKSYKGVTIPLDIDGVLNVWEENEPLRMYSKWWEGREGRSVNRPALSTVPVSETSPIERPVPAPGYLKVFAHNQADNGKTMTVTVKTGESCANEEINFKLEGECVITADVLVSDVVSVVLPSNIVGCVDLMIDDFELACYPPYVTVPCYRRLRINTPCHTDQVLLQGSQIYKDICFDSDIVEIGSRAILKQAAKMFRYGDTGTESDEIAIGRIAEAKMKKLIKGAIERQRGNQKQDPSPMIRKSLIRNTSLYGRRKNVRY